jgi:hypothetical protein
MVLCREAGESAAMCHPNLLEQRYIITAVFVQPVIINSSYILCLISAPFSWTSSRLVLPGLLVIY